MSENNLIFRQTSLSAHVIAFCRWLRSKGFLPAAAEEADALLALSLIPLANPETMRAVLKAVLVKNTAQWQQFEAIYKEYWDNLEQAVDAKIKQGDTENKHEVQSKPNYQKPSLFSLKNWLYGNKSEEITEIAVYSPLEVLAKKDFGTFSQEEIKELQRWIQQLAKKLAKRKTRRFEKSRKHQNPDIRNTLRLSLRRGGEMIDLVYKKRKNRRLKLVLLCDVSQSMDLYSRFLIQLMYVFQNSYHRIETFVFSTSLQRITSQLQNNDIHKTLEKLSEDIPHWSGGTKIGASLNSFWQEYGERHLDKKSIVLILSDGWDTGEIEILEEAMHDIQRKSALLIWLNPLAGNPNYRASTEGMKAALPFIDIFAPIHNLESLGDLIHYLGKGKRKK